jgi:hypothetical protein
VPDRLDATGDLSTPWGRWYFDEDMLDQVAVWRILTIDTVASGHANTDWRYTPDSDPTRRTTDKAGQVSPYTLTHATDAYGLKYPAGLVNHRVECRMRAADITGLTVDMSTQLTAYIYDELELKWQVGDSGNDFTKNSPRQDAHYKSNTILG